MSIEYSPSSANSPLRVIFESCERRTVASYELELTRHRRTEIGLREALARETALLCQKDELIQRQSGLEPGVRSSAIERRANDRKPAFAAKPGDGECRSCFAIEPPRPIALPRSDAFITVSTHLMACKPLRSNNSLSDLCRDFSMMLSSEHPRGPVVVEGIEIKLPAVTAIPLGFIANELITNAVKYGTGRITVSLEPNPEKGYALSVSNDGPGLPDGFDPADRKGLGMRIIRSLVKQIGGELRIGRGERNQGTRFTVLFS